MKRYGSDLGPGGSSVGLRAFSRMERGNHRVLELGLEAS